MLWFQIMSTVVCNHDFLICGCRHPQILREGFKKRIYLVHIISERELCSFKSQQQTVSRGVMHMCSDLIYFFILIYSMFKWINVAQWPSKHLPYHWSSISGDATAIQTGSPEEHNCWSNVQHDVMVLECASLHTPVVANVV